VKKSTLRELSDYCKDEEEKKHLLSLSESKDADGKFVEEIEKKFIGLFDIVKEYKSLDIPLGDFF